MDAAPIRGGRERSRENLSMYSIFLRILGHLPCLETGILKAKMGPLNFLRRLGGHLPCLEIGTLKEKTSPLNFLRRLGGHLPCLEIGTLKAKTGPLKFLCSLKNNRMEYVCIAY